MYVVFHENGIYVNHKLQRWRGAMIELLTIGIGRTKSAESTSTYYNVHMQLVHTCKKILYFYDF